MKLVTTTHYLASHFGMEKAIDILADVGFDGIDFSAFASVFLDVLYLTPTICRPSTAKTDICTYKKTL